MISWVRALVLIGVSSFGLSIACSGDDGSDAMSSRPAGTEGGACLPSGGCDVGLVCSGGKCQRADGGGTGGGAGASGSSGANGTGPTGGSTGSGGSSGGSGGTSSGGSSTGGSSAGGTSGGGSAGTSPGGSGGTGGDGGTGGACTGSHPIVDGGTRFCAAGQCRCEDTDTCYATQQAARCCNGRLRCFVPDGGVACEGTHPLVDGGARFCDEQRCYCPGNDTCYPAATARACCGEAAQCR